MADPTFPRDDDRLERRLRTLGELPVPERPDRARLEASSSSAPGAAVDPSLDPPAVDLGELRAAATRPDRGSRRRGARALAAAAAVVVMLVVGVAVARSARLEVAGIGAELVGREFRSVAVTEAGVARRLPEGGPVVVTLAFDDDGRTVRAGAGCNSIAGDYAVEGGRLVVGDELGTTLMGCEPALLAQDEWLGALLRSSPTLAVTGDRLTLASGDTVVELVAVDAARPAYQPIVELLGRRWDVVSVRGRDGTEPVLAPDGVRPWVRFDVDGVRFDGVVTGFDGCRDVGGEAVAMEATITFADLARVDQPCPDEGREAVARTMGEVLRGEATYEVDGDDLTIRNGDARLSLRAAGGRSVPTRSRTAPVTTVAVADDDRTVTLTIECAFGADRFDHVAVTRTWEAVVLEVVVAPGDAPRSPCPRTASVVVELSEPIDGRSVTAR